MRNGIVDRKTVNRRWKYDQIWDLVELPDKSRIIYREVPDAPPKPKHKHHHTYWTVLDGKDGWDCGLQLDGASSLGKTHDISVDRLLNWKERVTCEGIAALYEREDPAMAPVDWMYDGDAIRARLKAMGHDADSVRDRKADVGTRAHGVLEALAAGESPEAADGYGQAVINWWRDRRPRVLACEQFVYSASHGFAGRFDLLAVVDYPFTDVHGDPVMSDPVWLIDLKTSGWLAPSMHVQLALYDLAARACGVEPDSDRRMILQVKDDGTYREVPCRATEEDALACIAVYRGAGRIERESGLPRAA